MSRKFGEAWMKVARFLFPVCVLVVGGQLAYGQGTATIVGVISDSAGALVPNAQVTLINEGTGLRRAAATDGGGRYDFPQLTVGNYRIEVSAAGFKKETRSDINLTAEQVFSANFSLVIGDVSESVEVSASVATLETAVSSVRSVVRRELIEDLPLNGRDSLDLQTLLPGEVNQPGARVSLSEEAGISVNGARGSDNNVILDGGNNVDVYDGTPTSLPNPDALQEFSVVSSSFDAEYGRSAGSLVSAVTKSGTNAYHGSAYDYLRNDVMDARSFFGGGLVAKPVLKRNQFGASLGGPIKRDKSFIFFAWESLRQVSSVTSTGTVMPSVAERAGDFSQSTRKPTDPLTSMPFPGNIIPPSRISQPAVQIANVLFPLPNAPGNTLTYNAPGSDNRNQYVSRFDHSFSNSDRIYVSYFYYDTFTVANSNLPLFNGYNHWTNNHVSSNYTKILSPTKVNSLTYTFNFLHFQRAAEPILPDKYPGSTGVAPGFRFQDAGVMTTPSDPKYTVSTRFGSVAGYFATGGNTYFDVTPWAHEFRDTLTITLGPHLIKIGGDFTKTEAYRHENISADGSAYSWGGSIANNGWASICSGLPSNYSQESSTVRTDSLYNSYGAFIQDDWKVRRNLTLNLGLRREPSLGVTDGNNEITASGPANNGYLPQCAYEAWWCRETLAFPLQRPDKTGLTFCAPLRFCLDGLSGRHSQNKNSRRLWNIFQYERDYLMNETQIDLPFVP